MLALTPDSDLEELDKPSENKKDEPFTEAINQHDALEVTIGNIAVVLHELRKKQLKFGCGSKYQKALKKLTLFFLLNPVLFNRQCYKKQKVSGTSDQPVFRLRSKFKNIPFFVIYHLTNF